MDLYPPLVLCMQGLLPCGQREAEMAPGVHPSLVSPPWVTVGPSSASPLRSTQAGIEETP